MSARDRHIAVRLLLATADRCVANGDHAGAGFWRRTATRMLNRDSRIAVATQAGACLTVRP